MKEIDLKSAVEASKSFIDVLGPVIKQSERWRIGQKVIAAILCFAPIVFLFVGTFDPIYIVALVLALLGVSFLTIKRKIIDAEVFVVRDKQGRNRAALTHEGQNMSLVMLDGDSKPRLNLSVNDNGSASLILFDSDLSAVAGVIAPHDSTPVLQIGDSDGQTRTILNNFGLTLLDKSGVDRLLVGVSESGDPALFMNDQQGEARATMSVSDTAAGFSAVGHGGKGIVDVKSFEGKDPIVLLRNKENNPIVIVQQHPEHRSGSVQLYDSEGRQVWPGPRDSAGQP